VTPRPKSAGVPIDEIPEAFSNPGRSPQQGLSQLDDIGCS